MNDNYNNEYQQDNNEKKLHSVEAEEALLGCIFRDPPALEEVSFLKPSHFCFQNCTNIYKTLLYFKKSGRVIDLFSVVDYLQSKGLLEQIGGDVYLQQIAESVPSSANILSYAKVIVERYAQRTIKEKLLECSLLINDNSGEDLYTELQNGMASIQATIEDASPVKSDIVTFHENMVTAIKNLDERFNNGRSLLGASTGLEELDELTGGMVDGDFIVIGARPSTGKTALGINLAQACADDNDNIVVLFSAEMPTDSIMQRMLASSSGVSAKSIKTGDIQDSDWQLLLSSVERTKANKIIIDDQSSLTPDYIKAKLRNIQKEYGKIGMVLVDYLQLMTVPNFKQGKRLEITECSHAMKKLAKDFNCPVVALSQCTREVDKRADKRPGKQDLMEAGAIEADADVIITLYADDVHNPESTQKGVLEVIVCKNRSGEIGKVKTFFDRRIQKVRNIKDLINL